MPFSYTEIGQRLRQKRIEADISADIIASALSVPPEVYLAIEDGGVENYPGDYILIASQILRVDYRFFISSQLDDIENQTVKLYRSLRDPSGHDLLTLRRFSQFCINESDLEKLLAISARREPPDYSTDVRSQVLHKDQGRDVARRERARLQLGDRPIENVFELVRGQGVRLFRQPLRDSSLSGATVINPAAGICVLVNSQEDIYRQFFSAAHEYCHVLLDRRSVIDKGHLTSYSPKHSDGDLVEFRANAFASEFLVPSNVLRRLPKQPDVKSAADLALGVATKFRVNYSAAVFALFEAGVVSSTQKDQIIRKTRRAVAKGDKVDPEVPKEFTPRQRERRSEAAQRGVSGYYLELLRRAMVQDLITLSRFAEMLDMSAVDAMKFINDIGIAV